MSKSQKRREHDARKQAMRAAAAQDYLRRVERCNCEHLECNEHVPGACERRATDPSKLITMLGRVCAECWKMYPESERDEVVRERNARAR